MLESEETNGLSPIGQFLCAWQERCSTQTSGAIEVDLRSPRDTEDFNAFIYLTGDLGIPPEIVSFLYNNFECSVRLRLNEIYGDEVIRDMELLPEDEILILCRALLPGFFDSIISRCTNQKTRNITIHARSLFLESPERIDLIARHALRDAHINFMSIGVRDLVNTALDGQFDA